MGLNWITFSTKKPFAHHLDREFCGWILARFVLGWVLIDVEYSKPQWRSSWSPGSSCWTVPGPESTHRLHQILCSCVQQHCWLMPDSHYTECYASQRQSIWVKHVRPNLPKKKTSQVVQVWPQVIWQMSELRSHSARVITGPSPKAVNTITLDLQCHIAWLLILIFCLSGWRIKGMSPAQFSDFNALILQPC